MSRQAVGQVYLQVEEHAGIIDGVIAGAAEHRIEDAVADDPVVTTFSIDDVAADAAIEAVIAVTAEEDIVAAAAKK
jgi:hypothetical protein